MQPEWTEAPAQFRLGHDREQEIAKVLDVEGSYDSDFHRGAVSRCAALLRAQLSIHVEKLVQGPRR